jgi:hypothetical protein
MTMYCVMILAIVGEIGSSNNHIPAQSKRLVLETGGVIFSLDSQNGRLHIDSWTQDKRIWTGWSEIDWPLGLDGANIVQVRPGGCILLAPAGGQTELLDLTFGRTPNTATYRRIARIATGTGVSASPIGPDAWLLVADRSRVALRSHQCAPAPQLLNAAADASSVAVAWPTVVFAAGRLHVLIAQGSACDTWVTGQVMHFADYVRGVGAVPGGWCLLTQRPSDGQARVITTTENLDVRRALNLPVRRDWTVEQRDGSVLITSDRLADGGWFITDSGSKHFVWPEGTEGTLIPGTSGDQAFVVTENRSIVAPQRSDPEIMYEVASCCFVSQIFVVRPATRRLIMLGVAVVMIIGIVVLVAVARRSKARLNVRDNVG